MAKLISQGAEGKIYDNGSSIVKVREEKKYRLKIIDEMLRKSRTKREAKILQTLQKINFSAPKLISIDEKKMEITMQKIKGEVLRNALEKNHINYGREIGRKIAIMHNNEIIHGDLTTSNMIIGDEIYFIDFGLSFFSKKSEDKAVDLHLLHQGLESKHYRVYDKCFEEILKSYKTQANNSEDILERYKKVEERGRNKVKV